MLPITNGLQYSEHQHIHSNIRISYISFISEKSNLKGLFLELTLNFIHYPSTDSIFLDDNKSKPVYSFDMS